VNQMVKLAGQAWKIANGVGEGLGCDCTAALPPRCFARIRWGGSFCQLTFCTEENLLNCLQGKETYNLHGTWLSSKPWGKGKVSAAATSDPIRAAYCSYAAALGMGSALLLLGTRLPVTILHCCCLANLPLALWLTGQGICCGAAPQQDAGHPGRRERLLMAYIVVSGC